MIATFYYLNTNPIGTVSLIACVVTVISAGLVTDQSFLPERVRLVVKLFLPIVFVIGGIMCTPDKFVVGENVMGKIVFYVFSLAISLDLFRSYRSKIRVYGLMSTIMSVIVCSNIFLQLVIRQRFYHVFGRSPVGIVTLIAFLVLNGPILLILARQQGGSAPDGIDQ